MFCHQIYSLFGHLNQVILILSALILILDPTKGNNLLLMILIPTLITSTTIVFLAIVYVCFRRKIVESMNNFSVIYEFFLNQIKNFKDMNPLPFPQGCWKTSKQVQRQIGETEKFQFDKGEAERYTRFTGESFETIFGRYYASHDLHFFKIISLASAS